VGWRVATATLVKMAGWNRSDGPTPQKKQEGGREAEQELPDFDTDFVDEAGKSVPHTFHSPQT